ARCLSAGAVPSTFFQPAAIAASTSAESTTSSPSWPGRMCSVGVRSTSTSCPSPGKCSSVSSSALADVVIFKTHGKAPCGRGGWRRLGLHRELGLPRFRSNLFEPGQNSFKQAHLAAVEGRRLDVRRVLQLRAEQLALLGERLLESFEDVVVMLRAAEHEPVQGLAVLCGGHAVNAAPAGARPLGSVGAPSLPRSSIADTRSCARSMPRCPASCCRPAASA